MENRDGGCATLKPSLSIGKKERQSEIATRRGADDICKPQRGYFLDCLKTVLTQCNKANTILEAVKGTEQKLPPKKTNS